MPLYAQVLLEHDNVKYQPGDAVPEGLPGIAALIEHEAVGSTKPTQQVVIDTDGKVLNGDGPRISRFDGDFTGEQIDDPDVDTPLLGTHNTEAEHREQEPSIYDEGQAVD